MEYTPQKYDVVKLNIHERSIVMEIVELNDVKYVRLANKILVPYEMLDTNAFGGWMVHI
ncbi:MAG: hypothetical protein WC365_01395 [Candidatus Babeliales bacterium]|jgi:hypothetical protein